MSGARRTRDRLLALGAVLLACSACVEPASRDVTADRAFCEQIHGTEPRLATYLAPFDSLMIERTGVYSLEEGDQSMIARAWLTDAAETSIDVQYFIFSADNVGLIAVEHLLRAAERGVRVRLLVDDFMIETDADALLALDAHPNLEIRLYNPTTNIGKNLPTKFISLTTDFRGFNQRMHNKAVIVDRRVVITGGRNIADEYFDYDHAYNFRDRDVLLLGGVATAVQRSFDEFWEHPLSVPIATLVETPVADAVVRQTAAYLHAYACDPTNFWPQVRERITAVPETFAQIVSSGSLAWVDSVEFISDAPGKNDGSEGLGGGGASTDALIALIRGAERSVTIQSPYLVTTSLSQDLFKEVIARGVQVRVLTNSLASTDNLEAFSGYQRERTRLLGLGVELYEFRPDAAVRREVMSGTLQERLQFTPIFGLHAKSMVIDGRTAVIGTFNLDPRSANLNTECVTVIRDVQVAEALMRAMEVDMRPENAWHTTAEFNPDGEAPFRKRLKAWTRRIVPRAVL